MIKTRVELRVTGTVQVPDKWTDDAIVADTDGFDEAVLDGVSDALEAGTLEFSVEDAVTEGEDPAGE